MTLTHLDDRQTKGTPDPTEVITTTLNSVTFKAGRRTAAHLAWTDEDLRHGGMWLRVIQPCYNSSVSASAGTHDGDGCLDVQVMNASWIEGQWHLRILGWAAWYRPATPGLWGDHIHMASLGCPGPVGMYVPGQVGDYYDHRTGLKGHAYDPTRFPGDIDSTVFDYPRWIEENTVTPEDIEATAKRAAELVLGAKVGNDDTTVKQAINKILTKVERL